jgi:hypothetical protein
MRAVDRSGPDPFLNSRREQITMLAACSAVPSALAVLRLTTKSNLGGFWTGLTVRPSILARADEVIE